LLLNKIHVDDDINNPVRLIQVNNNLPTIFRDGVVHPTTATRVSDYIDEHVIYAQAEIEVDIVTDDNDNNDDRRGTKVYRGNDLHTVV